MLYLPVILMGVSSIILQIMCLRQLLSTFSGNELIIGLTLAVWLLIVGLGSSAGTRFKSKNAFGLSFIFIALTAQPTIILIESIRPILSFELGEVIPLPSTILWTTLSMAALCFIVGVQFPLAVTYLKEKAPQTYSFEATGAFLGGALFTFILAGNVSTYKLTMIAAFINILASAHLLKRKTVLLLVIIPVLVYAGGTKILTSIQYRGLDFIERTESRYGEIVVLKTKEQLNIYSSKKFQFSYPDFQTEELTAHLPMSLHPYARELLIVGGSPAVIREFLKYPVSHIDFVEIDPELIEVSKGILNPEDRGYLNDKRVNILSIFRNRQPPTSTDIIPWTFSGRQTLH
jgi:spermidine synthase